MEDARPSIVSDKIGAWAIQPDSAVHPVKMGLRYDPDDPYAIQIILLTDLLRGARLKTWLFDRGLFARGLTKPKGSGNVRIAPWATTPHLFTFLALYTSREDIRLKAPRPSLAAFVRRTHGLVSPGKEQRHLDIDACITRLLADKQ